MMVVSVSCSGRRKGRGQSVPRGRGLQAAQAQAHPELTGASLPSRPTCLVCTVEQAALVEGVAQAVHLERDLGLEAGGVAREGRG